MRIQKIIKKDKERQIIILEENEKYIRRKLKDEISRLIELPSCVYSFTKGKSAKSAALKCMEYINKYNYFLKCDIDNYYSNINIKKLIDILKKYVDQIDIIEEIQKALTEEIEQCGVKGISIGSPLSNALSNIYLIDFDKYFDSNNSIKYIRFCDDMFFLSNKNILSEVETKLNEYGLKLNKQKTVLGSYGDETKFLGFYISKNQTDNVNYDIDKIIENNDVHNYIKVLYNLKDSGNHDEIESVYNKISESENKLLIIIFEFIINSKTFECLISDLTDKGEFKTAYEFKEVIDKFEDNDSEITFLKVYFQREKNIIFHK